MKYNITLLFLLLLLGACAAKPVIKPEQPVAARPSEELKLPDVEIKKEPVEAKKPEAPPVEKKAEEQYVMLNFENADIETVINTVGEMLKINYILAPGVTGKITIQSHNKIPVSELFSTFQTILEFNGFTAVKYGSFYRIVPIDTAKQQPVQIQSGKSPSVPKDDSFITQEIPLEYVKASEVANLLRNLMPRGADITVYDPANMLIVTAAPSGIMKFLKLLEAIDISPSERDSVKTFVYYVENGEAKKLVEILKTVYAKKSASGATPVRPTQTSPVQTPAPAAVPGRPSPARPQAAPQTSGASVSDGLAAEIEGDVVIDAYEDINAIIVKTTPRGFLALLDTIKKLDVQPKQVLIEVMIAEVNLDKTSQFGLEWLIKANAKVGGEQLGALGGFTASSNTAQFDTSTNQFTLTPSSGTILSHPADVFATILDPSKFSALITAAANKGMVQVIASPNILALDNKEAKIEIGNEVPVATSITSTAALTANNTATSQVQFKTVGTLLTVTPHINEKKQVTLKISQEVSAVGSTVQIGGQPFTGFSTRKANTTAIVQDGHTLILGGIIQDSDTQSREGIPYLSDLPVVGYLFGTTSNHYTKNELIIMVTPHVIIDMAEADQLTRDVQNRVKDLKVRLNEREERLRKNLKEMEKERD